MAEHDSIQTMIGRGVSFAASAGLKGGVSTRHSIYEVFILGKLMLRPLHGYMLHKLVRLAMGPTQQINWNTLYPLLQRLHAQGYTTLTKPTQPGDDEAQTDVFGPEVNAVVNGQALAKVGGRQRKIFAITPSGRERFYALMLAPEEYTPEYPDLFIIKVASFGLLTPAQRLPILERFCRYQIFLRDYLLACRQTVASTNAIPEIERTQVLRIINHRLSRIETDFTWVDGEIAAERAQISAPGLLLPDVPSDTTR